MASDERIPILYLLTNEISSVLVRGQLGYLSKHGFDITVGTRSEPNALRQRGTWDDGVTVEHVPFVREPSPLADLGAFWATIKLIRRVRPTIVNASTPKAGLLGMLAARLCGVPVRVYVVRGFRFETATGWRRRLLVALEWLAVVCANHVIFNSRSLMAVGESEGVIRPGLGEVLSAGSGNGIDVTRFADDQLPTQEEAREHFGLPVEAKVIGFVGRFTKDKGVEDLIEAFDALSPQSPWLLLVGQFETGDPIAIGARATIESHPSIVVVSWLDDPGPAFRAMDVLAFPSYREGLPNVPLEAQLCGVPVVGYSATGTVDAVLHGTGGRLVKLGDIERLVAELGGLLDDADERVRMGCAGRSVTSGAFGQPQVWRLLIKSYHCWLPNAADGKHYGRAG